MSPAVGVLLKACCDFLYLSTKCHSHMYINLDGMFRLDLEYLVYSVCLILSLCVFLDEVVAFSGRYSDLLYSLISLLCPMTPCYLTAFLWCYSGALTAFVGDDDFWVGWHFGVRWRAAILYAVWRLHPLRSPSPGKRPHLACWLCSSAVNFKTQVTDWSRQCLFFEAMACRAIGSPPSWL